MTSQSDRVLFGLELNVGEAFDDAGVSNIIGHLTASRAKWSLVASRTRGNPIFATLDVTNSHTMAWMRAVLTSNWWEPVADGTDWGSDTMHAMINTYNPTIRFTFRRIRAGSRPRDNRSMAYLPYALSGDASDLDLRRYQLYNKPEDEGGSTHCLIHSLRLAGVPEAKLVEVDWKFIGKQTHISKKAFEAVAVCIGRRLSVVALNKNEKADKGFTRGRTAVFNVDADGDSIELGLIHSHVFFNEPTLYSGYYIRNIKRCREFAASKGWTDHREHYLVNDPYNRGYKFDRSRAMSSIEVFKYLFYTNTAAVPLVVPDLTGSFSKKRDVFNKSFSLSADMVNESQLAFRVNTNPPKVPIFACDIEATVDGEHHCAIMAAGIRIHGESEATLEELYGHTSEVINYPGETCLQHLFEHLAKITLSEHEAGGEEIADEVEEDTDFDEKKKYPEAIAMFHNLKYDSKHLVQAFRIRKMVQKGTTLYGLTFVYNGVSFRCMDSLKVIDMPLGDFQCKLRLPECFNKRGDLIAYSYYRKAHAEEYDEHNCTLDDYVMGHDLLFNAAERSAFKAGVVEELASDPESYQYDADAGTFNPMYLYRFYLMWDVRVLAAGLHELSRAINSIPGLTSQVPVLGKMTLPSIAKTLFALEGCFNTGGKRGKPIIGFTGMLRSWLGRGVAGGRVMPSLTCPYGLNRGQFQYVDACSLYPTAVVRLCRDLGGFPAGRAHILTPDQLTAAFLFDVSRVMTFVVRIRVTAIGRAQSCGIPAISFLDEATSSRRYCNSMPEGMDFFECYVGSVGLEDAIAIHDITYEVVEGIYFEASDVKASTYGDVVQKLYDRRAHVEYGSDGKVTSKVKTTAEGESIKRLLNSGAYGVFIQRASDLDYSFMPGKDLNSYVYNEFHRVYRYQKFGKQWMVELYGVDPSCMPVHWGILVLEMSKRVMNEVLTCLSSIGGRAYYTDTDSITLDNEDVEPLRAEFMRVHGRELFGDQLGQFHSDFSMKDDKGKPIPEDNIVSEGFACGGKKTYLHLLKGTTDDGSVHYGYKTSAKGITKGGLEAKALELCPDRFRDAKEKTRLREGLRVMFSLIAEKDDEGYEIDLFPALGKKRKFEYTSDTVSTSSSKQFSRVLRNTRKE